MPIKAVFFDLDGTLVDTAPDFVQALKQLTDEYQLLRIPESQIRQTVSDGARALTALTFPSTPEGKPPFDNPAFEERRQRLLDIYYDCMGKHCVLFDGMAPLLEKIKAQSLHWGIVTNKPYRFSEGLVKNLPWPTPPEVLICPDHVKRTKPDPEPLVLACHKVGCTPAETLYIGDHQRDIDCGIAAGSKTIAVKFGYIKDNDAIENWRADYIVAHAQDIWPIIQDYLVNP